jgi:hypothetical protein
MRIGMRTICGIPLDMYLRRRERFTLGCIRVFFSARRIAITEARTKDTMKEKDKKRDSGAVVGENKAIKEDTAAEEDKTIEVDAELDEDKSSENRSMA